MALPDPWPESTPRYVVEVVDEAVGRTRRQDPVLARTGGPAGNARVTAWTGLVLLALIAVELVTLLDLSGLLSWHIVVGTVLVPVALLKTATTGWRMLRYYTGNRHYRVAGPPPMVLRLLGPLVVISTLGVLGTGLALIAQGPTEGRSPYFSVLGQGIDMLFLHKAFFVVFAVVTGLHVLGRLLPAVTLATGKLERHDRPRVSGGSARGVLLLLALVAGALVAAVVLAASSGWQHSPGFEGSYEGLAAHVAALSH